MTPEQADAALRALTKYPGASFFTRRVLQRWSRGEISIDTAVQLLQPTDGARLVEARRSPVTFEVTLQIDPEEQTPGRKITHDKGQALVASMEAALAAGDKEAAQCVAAEAVTMAELVDHANWELIGQVSKKMSGAEGKALKEAYKEVEDQEDEHYYHSKGWLRELSLEGLGLKAVLPPPEERKHVKTAIGAARAEQERKTMR